MIDLWNLIVLHGNFSIHHEAFKKVVLLLELIQNHQVTHKTISWLGSVYKKVKVFGFVPLKHKQKQLPVFIGSTLALLKVLQPSLLSKSKIEKYIMTDGKRTSKRTRKGCVHLLVLESLNRHILSSTRTKE